MPKLTINDQEVEVEEGMSVIQACQAAGIEIPHFCYHDKLSVPANCRMCLVEQEGVPKPMPSCAIKAMEGMKIKTDSEMVHKARKGVMEFMLINHPLDCPICDQGGECDLQDQAVSYGFDRSRYQEEKRAVKDKELGPLIKTVMTRCIHCTRCIRFGEQVGGVTDLGLLGRGEDTEVGTFVENFVQSELSGNLVDVCPVGALTSKPYAFKARPWELRKTESIDVLDAVGSNIRVDTRSNAEVMRIMPRLNEEINEDWISDKTRYAYDGLKRQRLDRPYYRKSKRAKLEAVDWETALGVLADKIQDTNPIDTAVIVGDQVDCETITALKDLTDALKIKHRDCRQDGAQYDVSTRSAYIMNSTIAQIEESDCILLVGTNPRWEASMVNARIRKAFYERKVPIGLIGEQADLNYDYEHLGNGPKTLEAFLTGKSSFAKQFKKAKKPVLIVGASALARKDGAAIQYLTREIATKYKVVSKAWNGYNVLQMAASRVGGLDLGFVPAKGGKATKDILKNVEKGQIKLLYLVGADEFALDKKMLKDTFVVYQGHHGDNGASVADLILPSAAYTEKNATYVNTEGRPQRARQAMFPLGEAKEGWTIIRALSDHLGKTLPYDNLFQLQKRMVDINPIFDAVGRITPTKWTKFGKKGTVVAKPFTASIENFYMTCPITRSSEIMAQCTQAFLNNKRDYTHAAE